jgi:glycosyl transferase family 25
MGRMTNLQAWVINLDRASDRLQRIAARLQHLGLAWTRLRAVDAHTLTDAQRAELDEPGYQRRHGKTSLPGELGCYLSHVAALRAFLDSNALFGLVLEDDVQVLESLPSVLAGLMAIASQWDVVKLSAVHSGTPVAVHPVVPGHDLAVMLSRCTGSSAYLVNRRAAQAYLDPARGLLPMQLPYDHVFDQGWRFRLKVRVVTPTPCLHDDQVVSTIGAPADTAPRKFHWTKRWPTYAWRLGNEWRRLVYGLGETLREKRAR